MDSTDHQLHVFFVPHLAHGHMIPMVDMARLFSLRGVKSTIITTPLNAISIFSKITHYQNSGLDINITTIPFPCKEAGLPEGCEHLDSLPSGHLYMNFLNAIAMLQPHLESLVQEMNPDCIVSDTFLAWSNDVARKHGIPRIAFQGTSFFYLSVADCLKRHGPNVSDTDEPFSVPGLPDDIKMTKSQLENPVGSMKGFKEVEDKMNEQEAASYGMLVNSFYELEPVYADYCRNVMRYKAWHIGPVSLNNRDNIDKAQRGKKATIDEHYCMNWLSSKDHNSVIYISFGSIANFGSAQLREIAQGLESSQVSFIWIMRSKMVSKEEEEKKTYLPDGFEDRMEGKGLVITGWAPQVLILEHPAIGGFLTHCGWNSILECVSAGVPMITWPVFNDQFQNEILITELLKIGMKIGTEGGNSWMDPGHVSVSKEKIDNVVKEFMKSGQEMRKRAGRFKEMAMKAVEEGGSSYSDLTALIDELHNLAVIKQ